MNAGPHRGMTHHPDPPADAIELERFPSRSVSGVWFRAHVDRGRASGRDHGCWWFASSDSDPAVGGRFDLPPPLGTCYFANTEEAAVRERVGTQVRKIGVMESVTGTVLATSNGPVVVSAVRLPPTVAANLSVKAAHRWINRSLAVGTGIYRISQAWATAFRSAGFGAIVYAPRFTFGERERALALFGPADRPSPRRPIVSVRLAREVLEDHGVRIVDPPSTTPSTLAPSTPPPPL
jgi:RES domain